nr:hypothetical protein [uncultured Undibacterium sp.]
MSSYKSGCPNQQQDWAVSGSSLREYGRRAEIGCSMFDTWRKKLGPINDEVAEVVEMRRQRSI